jgi:BASS family bile acid:Na+ symporter
LVAVIIAARFESLAAIRLRAYIGMLTLLLGSIATGWLLGGAQQPVRKALTLTTALRNFGVGLVIATSSFPESAALTAVVAYALTEISGSVVPAWMWGRRFEST